MSDRSEGPVWDGEGTDPWLGARTAQIGDAAEAERSVWAAIWQALVDWLRAVREALADTGDPDVVWRYEPDWNDAVTVIANTTIYDIAEAAYTRTTGDTGYPVDMAAAARQRAATRANQLTGVPGQVYALIQRQITDAVTEGTDGDTLAAQIDDTLDATATDRWANRATVIARTESISALNAGRDDGHQAIAARNPGRYEKVWVATLDDRTRPTHRAADGQRVPVNGLFAVGAAMLPYPGYPPGPPEETIQCRCTTVLARAGRALDAPRRA